MRKIAFANDRLASLSVTDYAPEVGKMAWEVVVVMAAKAENCQILSCLQITCQMGPLQQKAQVYLSGKMQLGYDAYRQAQALSHLRSP